MINYEKDITTTIREISKTLKSIEKVLRRKDSIYENEEINEMHYRCNICKNDFAKDKGKNINNTFFCTKCMKIITEKHFSINGKEKN